MLWSSSTSASFRPVSRPPNRLRLRCGNLAGEQPPNLRREAAVWKPLLVGVQVGACGLDAAESRQTDGAAIQSPFVLGRRERAGRPFQRGREVRQGVAKPSPARAELGPRE